MTVSAPESPFSATRFFPLAAKRLDHQQSAAADLVRGDHDLNPDFANADVSYRDAAVLIPVIAHEPEVKLLLTVRATHLNDHAGQIAFPGGKIDASDPAATDTALREAEEEIGLGRSAVELVGTLPSYLSRTGFRIAPILGRVEPGMQLRLNPAEVEHVFEVPLAFLMNPANHRRTSRVFWGKTRYFYEMPYEGHYIWGVTAGIIRELYVQVFA
ncbi:MAG: CoA pyrophosphatase [Hyphomicrobiales bacterium]|nr:CoA pyrophosphatase [Hyphomicrobiales bacterium]